jgi:PAS domain S-box-containing protein
MPNVKAATILVVDDDVFFRQTVCLLLSEQGHVMREAGSGHDALTHAREGIDLVILDVSLPDLDGFEVCQRLKEDPATVSLPVLHLSAHFIDSGHRAQGLERGADGYLTKPVEPRELIAHVNALLRAHRAEEAAKQAARHWKATFDAVSEGIGLLDAHGVLVRCNRALAELFQKPADDLVGQPYHDLIRANLGEEVAAGLLPSHQTRTRQTWETTTRSLPTPRWFRVNVDPLFDERGEWSGTVHLWVDVTEQRQLEEQFRQSQKMEAVGRLAGGIAHDFNNLLTVIGGYSEFLLVQLGSDDPMHKSIQEIQKAADRAAQLTSQLLAFSRRQVSAPRLLNLDLVLDDLRTMLLRLIGEDVELIRAGSVAGAQVKIDPGQIQQVVMNLAVNSRDAMPQGGKLTLTTSVLQVPASGPVSEGGVSAPANVPPGGYVAIQVSDTGCGMDEQTLSHLFEPFFTTKGVGRGTGLGLATVYGIIEANGGHIGVASQPGQGTTITLYLPRMGESTLEGSKTSSGQSPQAHGTETILLVEDEATVRGVLRTMLVRSGFQVLEASRGSEALQIGQTHPGPIHLLVTDVVMPNMSGRQVAEGLAPIRPEMKVLYVSGYTDDEIVRHGVREAAAPFLQKPFTPQALAIKVREVLDR